MNQHVTAVDVGGDDGAGPVRPHVVERDAEVIIEAERQTDGALPFVPRSCAPTAELVLANAQLEAPLDDRTLHGRRLVNSGKATNSTFDADDDSRRIPPSMR